MVGFVGIVDESGGGLCGYLLMEVVVGFIGIVDEGGGGFCGYY